MEKLSVASSSTAVLNGEGRRRLRSSKRFCGAIGIFTFACLLGCQEATYDVAPVRGTVTIDGQPFAQGKVMFAPIAQGGSLKSGKPAFGPLQPDGSFVLSTYGEEDGAVVADHWVTVISLDQKATNFARMTVREKQTVAAGSDNQFAIQLTKQEIARYGVR